MEWDWGHVYRLSTVWPPYNRNMYFYIVPIIKLLKMVTMCLGVIHKTKRRGGEGVKNYNVKNYKYNLCDPASGSPLFLSKSKS